MRRVRRKGGNKEKVFGCDLLEHLTASSQEIPQVLRYCSEFVEQNGIVDGIYRLSGVSSNIQKLRGEFENDGTPDLNKDVYLQDIHCVSSLCKAYFRELPNPLLTYQLYDKFAEAVAIQLEEERLVKIRDVLKELPALHYRTLEFLMRHLVRMASYSSETNMHARNLAIVWAPNLLRSKDIEASGFNGTAAFMEVRVQSIVVEFILTHVPQLFPGLGVTNERRKSLPSPTAAMANQDEGFFKSVSALPVANYGNISPGDGPLPIRPYHAIIEGTDKRKGSLKGRKWMSIFNIGGRFQDQRRRHKHSAKEKERPTLRPARSMDSLSSPPYPNEGSRHPSQRPPSTHMSPLATPSPQPGLDVTVSPGTVGGSEYAVTYRRGTGLVSGGTQGTYTSLDPEGLGIPGIEGVQSRSPGLSAKAGRRAAMHITGPTLVTVPLHITSNLALGVLQGGGGDRVILRGRDKDGGDKVEGKEGGEKRGRKESRETERKVEEGRKVEEEKSHRGKNREGVVGIEETTMAGGVGGDGEEEEEEEEKCDGGEAEEDKKVRGQCRWDEEAGTDGRGVSREQRVKSHRSDTEADHDEDAEGDEQHVDNSDDYMDMQPADHQPAMTQHTDDTVFDASDVLNSTEVVADDHELSGYVQDNFEFLDQMDCSVMDHMDCSVSYQVNEFSVEPPGHSDDEYELMVEAQTSHHPTEPQTHLQPDPERRGQSETAMNPHRPLSLDIHNRHTKSLSLPYMTSPVYGPEESSSEEEAAEDDSDSIDYSSDEDEGMLVKSLPPDFFLNTLELDTDQNELLQSSEEGRCHTLDHELSACEETTTGGQEQVEVEDTEDKVGLEDEEITEKEEEDDEVHQEREPPGNNMQSRAAEEPLSTVKDAQSECSVTSEASTPCCVELPPPSSEDCDESGAVADVKVEGEEKEEAETPHSDCPPHAVAHKETADVPSEESGDFSVTLTEDPGSCVSRGDAAEREDGEGEEESDESTCEKTTKEGGEGAAENEGSNEQDGAICSDIWDELEEVICEVIEDKESEQSEREGDVGQEDVVKDGDGEEEEEEKMEVDKGDTNQIEVRAEEEEESSETSEGKLPDPEMEQASEEDETDLPKRSDLEKATQEKHVFSEEAPRRHRGEVVSKQPEKENNDTEGCDEQHRTAPSVDKQLKEVRSDTRELEEDRTCEKSDSSLGGVGRKLVVSKQPRVYQVKAVPVVPPKPQHCKITALTLRQQQQQRERRDKVCPGEQGRDGDVDEEGAERREKPTLRGGERERERRRDGAEAATRDTSRNSPLSMCFDEAVAIATMRREKERVREGDGEMK